VQTFTDIYKYRFILSNLVGKELKAQYRNMSMGFLWALLNPLVMVTVLSLAWTMFLGADASFPVLVLVALIPYNFFTYCFNGCSASILGNVSLVKKIRFPRQILPISVIITHLIHFAIQFVLVIAVLLIFPHPGSALSIHLLWLPVILVVQIGLVVGVGLLIAGLNVIYRDVQYIVESLLVVLFWGSPILWTAGPESNLAAYPILYHLYYLNPLAGILEAWRSVLYYGRSPSLVTFGMATGIAILLGIIGVASFWKHERDFADLI